MDDITYAPLNVVLAAQHAETYGGTVSSVWRQDPALVLIDGVRDEAGVWEMLANAGYRLQMWRYPSERRSWSWVWCDAKHRAELCECGAEAVAERAMTTDLCLPCLRAMLASIPVVL